MKKTILSLLLILGLSVTARSQSMITNSVHTTQFNYLPISDNEHHFTFSTSFTFGSPGGCPQLTSEISISNDTLYVKGFYDTRGVWAAMGCGTSSTVIYNNSIPPTIHFIKMSTNIVTYDETPPYEDFEIIENVYSRIFDLSLGVKTNTFRMVSITPNPTKSSITVSGDMVYDRITVTNNLGQEVAKFGKNENDRYDFEFLSDGLYYIEYFDNDAKVGVSKVCKQY